MDLHEKQTLQTLEVEDVLEGSSLVRAYPGAFATVRGFPRTAEGVTYYDSLESRSPYGITQEFNPAENYWRAQALISEARNVLEQGTDELTIVTSSNTGYMLEDPRVHTWVRDAVEKMSSGTSPDPLILDNGTDKEDRPYCAYVTVDYYPEQNAVILRSAADSEISMDVSESLASDGFRYDSVGMFPRFTRGEAKDVYVARERSDPGKQALLELSEIERVLDLWVPPGSELETMKWMEQTLSSFSLRTDDAKRMLGGIESTVARGIDYLNNHPDVPGEQTTFFYKAAVMIYEAALDKEPLAADASRLQELGDRLSLLMHTRGDGEMSDELSALSERLSKIS